LVAQAEKSRRDNDIRLLEDLAKRYPDSIYAKAVQAAVEILKSDAPAENVRDAYFQKLIDALPEG
jgi:hypothetical protein